MLIVERFDREGLYQLQNCGETNRRITEVKVCREFAVLRVFTDFARSREGSSLDNWWQRRDHLAEGKRS